MPENQAWPPLAAALADELRSRDQQLPPAVLEAVAATPRHLFLPEMGLDVAYRDAGVVCKQDFAGRATLVAVRPTTLAGSLAMLRPRKGHNVLEIGAGTGYSAALLAHLVGPGGRVTSLELDPVTADQALDHLQRASAHDIQVVQADGAQGYAPRATYDRLFSSVGVWDIPVQWRAQLREGGRMVVPVTLDAVQVCGAFAAQADQTWLSVENRSSDYPYMQGADATPDLRLPIGTSGLTVITDEPRKLDTVSLHLLLSEDVEVASLGADLQLPEALFAFQLFLMLREPPEMTFALFHVNDTRMAYGLAGRGLMLFARSSACFVPYEAEGRAWVFGGADAYLAVLAQADAWQALGRPGVEQLRMRLVPRRSTRPAPAQGKRYPRRDHTIEVWMETDD
jgi:protein-L-isoaspartate(D-aspartate) O-methyltransferase